MHIKRIARMAFLLAILGVAGAARSAPTDTPTYTPTATGTVTAAVTPTGTPTPATPTATSTITLTLTESVTFTPTPTGTVSSTATSTRTATLLLTPTLTLTPHGPAPTPTGTPKNAGALTPTTTTTVWIRVPGAANPVVVRQNVIRPACHQNTTIAVQLDRAQHVTIRIYTQAGKLVKVLEDRTAPAGTFETAWSGANENGSVVRSGVYIVEIQTESFSEKRKLAVVR